MIATRVCAVLVVTSVTVGACSGGDNTVAAEDASASDLSSGRADSGRKTEAGGRPLHPGSGSGSGTGSSTGTGSGSGRTDAGSGGGHDAGSGAMDGSMSDALDGSMAPPPNGGPPHGPAFAFPTIKDNSDSAMTDGVFILTILASNDTAQSSLQAFGAALPTSNWWKAVSATYDLGTAQHAELVGAALSGQNLTDASMIQYIRQTLASNGRTLGTGKYHGNTVSVLYLPDGVTYTGNDAECQTAGQGYHSSDYITPDTDFIWAVVQRCPPGNIANALQNTMAVGSHEIAESLTDPLPPSGYILPSMTFTMTPPAQSYNPLAYAPPDGEVADLCFGTYDVEGSYTYQRIWSNAAAKVGDPCVPAAPTPYESATTPQAWYPIHANSSVSIPVTGWSTSASPETWEAFATIAISQPESMFAVDTNWFSNGLDNKGTMSTISPTAAPTAASGDYGVVYVISETSTTSEMHYYPIGLYVP